MICRARPKYLSAEDIDASLENGFKFYTEFNNNEILLNSGSVAFKFFLENYKQFYGKSPKVAIQSFTCVTMLNAIVSAGAQAYIYDITIEDLTIDFDKIDTNEIDIIVLTNYQGIPCNRYKEVADLCDKNNILLFEDLSHGRMSITHGLQLGSRSCAYIESFSFDKPFTTLRGGRLVINDMDSGFLELIKYNYQKLYSEPDNQAINDIKTLRFLLDYTAIENYRCGFDFSYFMNMPIFVKLWSFRLAKYEVYVSMMIIIYKVLCHIIPMSVVDEIYKLNYRKIYLLYRQEERCKQLKYLRQKNYSTILGLKNEFEKDYCEIVWNRYSIIDNEGLLKKKMIEKGLSVGNFNWPKCLHQYNFEAVKVKSDCRNSEYVASHILNIPIWQI